jgi:transcriptional regulator with XRE-family HTH domain
MSPPTIVLFPERYREAMAARKQGPHTAVPASADVSSHVGRRIRELRTSRKVGLDHLATVSGLGKGTLSEVERGLRSPTLDTLFAIATSLSVPLSYLLLGEPGSASVDPRHAAPASGTSVDAVLLDRWADGDAVVEVYRITLRPARQLSKPHSRGVRETLSVVTGTVMVGVVGHEARLDAGASHTFAGDRNHSYRSISGPAVAVLTMYYPAAHGST